MMDMIDATLTTVIAGIVLYTVLKILKKHNEEKHELRKAPDIKMVSIK